MALTRKLLKGMGFTDEQVPNCPFVLFVGTEKLVKRREFEACISRTMAI